MDERTKLRTSVVVVMVLGMVVGQQSTADATTSFRDCYAKCFLFCMIEPTQTLCTCTTQCLKECIFPTSTTTPSLATKGDQDLHSQNLVFCKLGCATSSCSNISTKHNPDGRTMESCVGSCSDKCIMSYSSPSP